MDNKEAEKGSAITSTLAVYRGLIAGFAAFGILVFTGNIWLGFVYLNAAHNQKEILVPPGINGPLVITGGTLSREYLEAMVPFVKGLAFDYSSATARANFSVLLRHFNSETRSKAQTEFYDLAGQAERDEMDSRFDVSNISVDPQNMTILVKGMRKLWKRGDMVTGYPATEEWVIKYQSDGAALFSIYSLKPQEVVTNKVEQ